MPGNPTDGWRTLLRKGKGAVTEASPTPAERLCAWCRSQLRTTRGRFCGRRCRQTAFRLRRRGCRDDAAAEPMRFAYADPPYPGLSSKYYRHEPSFAGEVNFPALLSWLQERRQLPRDDPRQIDGWALSTSARSLTTLLPLCPREHRIAVWSKPHGVPPATFGIHNVWEPVIVVGGRQRPPGVPDHLSALPARGGGTLPGRKPIAFCAWLFRLLGAAPGDSLDDLFPGSGVVSRAWVELLRTTDENPPGVGDSRRRATADKI